MQSVGAGKPHDHDDGIVRCCDSVGDAREVGHSDALSGKKSFERSFGATSPSSRSKNGSKEGS